MQVSKPYHCASQRQGPKQSSGPVVIDHKDRCWFDFASSIGAVYIQLGLGLSASVLIICIAQLRDQCTCDHCFEHLSIFLVHDKTIDLVCYIKMQELVEMQMV